MGTGASCTFRSRSHSVGNSTQESRSPRGRRVAADTTSFCRTSAALRHAFLENSNLLGILWTRKSHHDAMRRLFSCVCYSQAGRRRVRSPSPAFPDWRMTAFRDTSSPRKILQLKLFARGILKTFDVIGTSRFTSGARELANDFGRTHRASLVDCITSSTTG